MSGGQSVDIADVTPDVVWDDLKKSPNALLVDCRTPVEWETIGVPDLSDGQTATLLVSWREAPAMDINPDFKSQLEAAIGDAQPERIYFLCRSGVRSKEAATFYQAILSGSGMARTCINVAEGFEGVPDADGKRGSVNGWQARGLPWSRD